jgi:hypothetical protein
MNFWYPKAVKNIGNGDLVLPNETCVAYLVNEQPGFYIPDIEVDEYLDDVPIDARIAVTDTLTGVVFDDDGVLRIDQSMFESVTGTGQGDAVLVVAAIGTDATSPLVIHLDDLGGVPVYPTGTDVDMVFNQGADGVGRI